MKSLSDLLMLHQQLDELFFEHQRVLLNLDLERASTMLERYEAELFVHRNFRQEIGEGASGASSRSGKLNPALKITLNVIGTLCVLLGILGVVLPLLPTTPFLLLASACYVRSSEKLYERLTSNKYLGTYILNFRDRQCLPLRAKIYTLLLLWASLLLSVFRFESPLLALVLILIGAAVSAFVLSIKTLRDD